MGMKIQLLVLLGVAALAASRPSDIIDFELDDMEHEQEGVAGVAVEGEYSWVDRDGTEHIIKYVADHLGYRVLENIAVPKVRSDSDEDDVEAYVARAVEVESVEDI